MKNRCWPYERTELKRRRIKIVIEDAKALVYQPLWSRTHSLFSFSTSITFRFHSSKVGISSGSLQLTEDSVSEVTGELKSCQIRGRRSEQGGLLLDENQLTWWRRSLLALSSCGTRWRPGAASWEQPESSGEGWGAFLQCERWKCSPEQLEDCFGDQRDHFIGNSLVFFNLLLNIKAAGVNLKSVLVYVLTCRDHTGFPLHSWRELGPDHWSQLQMHQVHPQKCCNKN